jgi:hypothetical protein
MNVSRIARIVPEVFLLCCTLLLGSSGLAWAQANRAKNFDEALKQASEKGMFVVLDISKSW